MLSESVPISVNQYIEQQLHEHLRGIEEVFNASGFCLAGPLISGVDDMVRERIEDLRNEDPEQLNLLVLLTTNGGSIEPVQRIVETIRHHYDYVSFLIPNYAFSAGTVLAMSGDDIYMDYYSRLGPIDPQVSSSSGRMVPALGYLKQWERLLEKAANGELTDAEFKLMLLGFDQAELYQFEQAREISVTLLRKWLATYKFKDWVQTETRKIDVDDAMRQERAEQIARALSDTDRWHIHGHGISMEVLENELGLKIDSLESDARAYRQIRDYDALLSDYMAKMGDAGVLHTAGTYQRYLNLRGAE